MNQNSVIVSILLFDGECAFCNACVQWLVKHERTPRYYFAALQDEGVAPLLQAHGIQQENFDSIVVIDGGSSYIKSAAAFHLLHETHWPWRILSVFRFLPNSLCDFVYDFIGARRYRWWGRAECCMVADPALKARQLDFKHLNKGS